MSLSAAHAASLSARAPLFMPEDAVVIGRPIRNPSEPMSTYGEGSTNVWTVNALGRPANATSRWGIIDFGMLEGEWLTSAKDLAMVLFNPSHPKLLGRTVPNTRKPAEPGTVRHHIEALRLYYDLARWHGFPARLADWQPVHFTEGLVHLETAGHTSETKLRSLVRVPRILHSFRDVIPGAPMKDPWPGPDGGPIARRFNRTELVTQPVHPDAYFALLDAALAYLDVFSTDIVKGIENLQASKTRYRNRPKNWNLEDDADDFFSDARRPVPIKHTPSAEASDLEWGAAINWRELDRQITGNARQQSFARKTRASNILRQTAVIARARSGATMIGGVVDPVERLGQREQAWSPGLDKVGLANERRMLREACFIVIASLTMMRDSEIQEIRKGSVTTYQGSPAIKSPLLKQQQGRPLVYWWISDAVERAIAMMEIISSHETHLFSTSRVSKHVKTGTQDMGGILASSSIRRFREKINKTSERTGLVPIPEGTITPHMLRRTMALVTERERGGQLATAHQLKHAHLVLRANALTGQYTAGSEAWAHELQEHRAHHDAQRALDDLARAPANRPIGPGAHRFGIALTAPAAVLDARTRARLLAHSFPGMRLGTANLCLGDPLIAECLSEAERVTGAEVRPTMCNPSGCGNSVVLPLHEQLWLAEEESLNSIRKFSKLSAHARAMVDTRLTEVARVTAALK